MDRVDLDVLRILAYNSNWDGTCGTCGNSCAWSPRYGNMRNMKKTVCVAMKCPEAFYSKNLMMKNSKPKWCPRRKELKERGYEI